MHPRGRLDYSNALCSSESQSIDEEPSTLSSDMMPFNSMPKCGKLNRHEPLELILEQFSTLKLVHKN